MKKKKNKIRNLDKNLINLEKYPQQNICPLYPCKFIKTLGKFKIRNLIKDLFCFTEYIECQRFLRYKLNLEVPEDLWPIEKISISEVLNSIGLSFDKEIERYRKFFLNFKNSFYFIKAVQQSLSAIEKGIHEDNNKLSFFKMFFEKYFDELFIKKFSNKFFLNMAYLIVKENIEEPIFDSSFLIYSTYISEYMYLWSLRNIKNFILRAKVLSSFIKLNTLTLIFIKRYIKLIKEIYEIKRTRKLIFNIKNELYVDPLTKVLNRRFLENYKDDIVKFYTHLMLVDIDHFKKINDTYGHQIGDKVLQNVSKIMKKLLRKKDLIIRYGGEEFLIAIDVPTDELAVKIAERIRKTIENTLIVINGDKIRITVSIGITKIDPQKSFEEIFAIADQALYEAKKTGRNKVVFKVASDETF